MSSQSQERTLYDVLGVPKTATKEDMRPVYRALALKWHPDRNPGDENAQKVFKEIAAAWGTLSDGEKKAEYDRKLRLDELRKRTDEYAHKTNLYRQYGDVTSATLARAEYEKYAAEHAAEERRQQAVKRQREAEAKQQQEEAERRAQHLRAMQERLRARQRDLRERYSEYEEAEAQYIARRTALPDFADVLGKVVKMSEAHLRELERMRTYSEALRAQAGMVDGRPGSGGGGGSSGGSSGAYGSVSSQSSGAGSVGSGGWSGSGVGAAGGGVAGGAAASGVAAANPRGATGAGVNARRAVTRGK